MCRERPSGPTCTRRAQVRSLAGLDMLCGLALANGAHEPACGCPALRHDDWAAGTVTGGTGVFLPSCQPPPPPAPAKRPSAHLLQASLSAPVPTSVQGVRAGAPLVLLLLQCTLHMPLIAFQLHSFYCASWVLC